MRIILANEKGWVKNYRDNYAFAVLKGIVNKLRSLKLWSLSDDNSKIKAFILICIEFWHLQRNFTHLMLFEAYNNPMS